MGANPASTHIGFHCASTGLWTTPELSWASALDIASEQFKCQPSTGSGDPPQRITALIATWDRGTTLLGTQLPIISSVSAVCGAGGPEAGATNISGTQIRTPPQYQLPPGKCMGPGALVELTMPTASNGALMVYVSYAAVWCDGEMMRIIMTFLVHDLQERKSAIGTVWSPHLTTLSQQSCSPCCARLGSGWRVSVAMATMHCETLAS